jgi:hypothetical protein
VHERRKEIHELRSAIHKADWSQQTEEQLDTLRNKLMTLLVELCELQLDTLSEQEIIDDSRQHKDSVADSVLAGEDTATRSERKQTLREIKHAVEEFDASTTEETRRKSQGNGKSTANGKDKAERS